MFVRCALVDVFVCDFGCDYWCIISFDLGGFIGWMRFPGFEFDWCWLFGWVTCLVVCYQPLFSLPGLFALYVS